MAAVPRLFIEPDLAEGAEIALGRDQSHYLVRVMRRGVGDPVRLFNGRDGDWTATLTEAGKRAARLRVEARMRTQTSPPDLWLLFAPVKKARTDFIVEKATELGAARIAPVFTAFTQSERVRTERLRALAIEAAEQTERMDVPEIAEAAALDAVLEGWDPGRTLIYCDEHGEALPLADALRPQPRDSARALLIGPEGGFSDEERARLRSLEFVRPVSLGPRILRADTAAAAGLALVQALWGDWRTAG